MSVCLSTSESNKHDASIVLSTALPPCKDCCIALTQNACPMQAAPTRFTGCADGLHVLRSAGPIAVKAAVLTIVEKMHAKGIGMLYAGWPTDGAQVGSTEVYMLVIFRESCRLLRAPADLPASN